MSHYKELVDYWGSTPALNNQITATDVYVGRYPQTPPQPPTVYAVIFPDASEEPLADTSGSVIETLKFTLHIHATTDAVVTKGEAILAALEWATPCEHTMGLWRTANRYVREATELHHYLIQFNWMVQI